MLQEIRDYIVYCDYELWYYVNTQWHNAFLDAIIPYFRNQYTWAPLYLFLLVFTLKNFGKRGLFWCLAFLLTFALSDHISAGMIKPYFHRLRPCNNPYLQQVVHIIVPCGSGYSFPSSHAANHFSLGVFMAITLGRRFKWVVPAALIWAFVVSYSQVYVGVHFPLDVTCGGLLGAAIGIMTGKLYNRYFDITEYNMVRKTGNIPVKE
ncbi:phosphatase PAP2 family protein [Chitinophagaceae bacterium MMS25-I14]